MIERIHSAHLAALLALCVAGTSAIAAPAPSAPYAMPQVLLDPDRLPHREAPAVKPRIEYISADALERIAESIIETSQDEPTPADLEETIDVRLSPGIESLAEALGGEPTAIFAWVRRNVAFTPIFGSVQGSEGCLLSRECGAHDTASLLIALLRVSDIPARYVTGQVTLDNALLMSVMGDFEDLISAAELASSGGTPVTLLLDGNNEVAAVRLEHAWVEAHVGGRWIALEGALKPTRFTPPIDAATAIGLDADAFVDVLTTGMQDANGDSITGVDVAQLEQMLDAVEDNLEGFQGSFPDDTTVGETIGAIDARIRRSLFDPATLQLLPPETMATNLANATFEADERVAELSASARHELLLELENPDNTEVFSFMRSLPELADQRLTLGYLPATQADADLVNASGGLFEAPPDQLTLRPQLYLQGELMEVGPALPMGAFQRLRVTITEPNASFGAVEHVVTAGTYAAVGLNLRRTGSENLRARREHVESIREEAEPTGEANLDDVLGEVLHSQAQIYFALIDAYARLAAHELDVVATRRPGEMLMALEPVFTRDAQNVPTETRGAMMTMDFRRNIGSFSSRTGSDEDKGSFQFSTGAFSSALEHAIFEIAQDTPSVSTVRLIDEANRQGMPVFAIDSRNLARVLPQLMVSDAVRDNVSDAVNGGNYVLIPRDPVDFLEWSGTGFMSLVPLSGDGGYFISGGLAGGSTAHSCLGCFPGTRFELTGSATIANSVEGSLFLLPRELEITEQDVRVYENGVRRWRPLSACARERINNIRRSTMLNGGLLGGAFGAVPGITGFTDIKYHVPSLSAFVFEILAEKLKEQREELGICELDDEELTQRGVQ